MPISDLMSMSIAEAGANALRCKESCKKWICIAMERACKALKPVIDKMLMICCIVFIENDVFPGFTPSEAVNTGFSGCRPPRFIQYLKCGGI